MCLIIGNGDPSCKLDPAIVGAVRRHRVLVAWQPTEADAHRPINVSESGVARMGCGAAHLRLETRAPFHLQATVRVLQRRPGNAVEIWDHGRYLRVLRTAEGLALVETRNCGTIDAPDLRYRLRHGNAPPGIAQILRKVLGLDVDPQPILRLARAHSELCATATALRGMRPPRFAAWFETFANVVPFQQVSLDAGIAVVGRLVKRFGEPLDHRGRRFHAFPTVLAISEARVEVLRECGLSLRKAQALRAVAAAIESGELAEDKIAALDTAEARKALVEVAGIGPWSAGVILLRGLGRLDVFPPGDVGANRGISALLGVERGAALARAIERFGDQRGYLYFHGLGSSLLAKGLIDPAPQA